MTGVDAIARLTAAVGEHRGGRLAPAEAVYRELLAGDPNNAHVLHLLGVLCHQTGRNAEAVEYLRRAISINDKVESFHCNFGMVLAKLNRFPEALAELEIALKLRPDSADAYGNLANVYKLMGEIEQGVEMARRATTLRKDPMLAGNLLYLMQLHPGYEPRQIGAAHRAWGQAFGEELKQFIRPWGNSREAGRRLKVGFVIPFLCDHPVVRFLLPYFEWHSREGFEISVYFDKGDISGAPESFKRVLSPPILLKSIAGLDDGQAAERIRGDGIDILIDVAMHTEDNRLLVFARKPAPVQMTWLAYAGTTGLDTIDYRLTDPYLDPAGFDPSVYTEKSLYLETFWCYWPPPEAPEVGTLPMLGSGRVTFGCLNNYAKVSGVTLDLWGRILGAVPGSRLILYCPEGAGRERAVSRLGRAGIGAERIGFVGPMKPAEYFATYNAIDVGLDPYPYGGGTTTCDALWMGVPVVSLTGKTAVSRAGVSILSNAGVRQLVANTPEQYVSIAAALAGDSGELERLRSSLRGMVQTSRLGDAGRFTGVFEAVLRQAWVAHCQSAG